MYILAIETSCDETACAVVQNGRTVHSNVVASQIEEHGLYGGVVPEIASRRHVEQIHAVCAQALAEAGLTLEDMDAVAVTFGPGLIGALLVGLNFAKGLALRLGKPLIPVHHIKGHIAANYIAHPALTPPFMSLVVSGGHSHLIKVTSYTDFEIIGQTVDDAAGEAFDKAARQLGFPYPGGVHIDKLAPKGDKGAYTFPTPKLDKPFHFSFSGLKTAVLNLVNNAKQKGESLAIEDIAASFQEKVTQILSTTAVAACKAHGCDTLVICGGVSANSGLREKLTSLCEKEKLALYMPPLSLCGDNAAMIGAQAYYEYEKGITAPHDLNAVASLPVSKKMPFEQ